MEGSWLLDLIQINEEALSSGFHQEASRKEKLELIINKILFVNQIFIGFFPCWILSQFKFAWFSLKIPFTLAQKHLKGLGNHSITPFFVGENSILNHSNCKVGNSKRNLCWLLNFGVMAESEFCQYRTSFLLTRILRKLLSHSFCNLHSK